MTQTKTDFNPCAIWPARVPDRNVTAKPIENGGKVGGAFDQKTATAHLPLGNNAYHRTIRLHESLHAMYTKRTVPKGGYTSLDQGLEDARLHLLHANTTGRVRRDELSVALRDLRRIPSDKNLAAILALRSSAILYGGEFYKGHDRAISKVRKMADSVSPEYFDAIQRTLDQLRAKDTKGAAETLRPFFTESPTEESKLWPCIGSFGDGDGEDAKEYADVSFAKLEGKLTSEAADMISPSMARSIEGEKRMPTLHIHQIFANANVPTFFGETEKHTLTGSKIDAKRLALVVGPAIPRLFTKTIHRNGGTIVIDASGSMNLQPEQLLKLLTTAPLATIGFYNAYNDTQWDGNLWIFAHKGKRAVDLRDVKMADSVKAVCNSKGKWEYQGWETAFGTGNVVDFQVIQWLLAQPAPRYILTDGGFVGPSFTSNVAAQELLSAAIARKKLTQITSFEEMQKVLSQKGVKL